VAKKKKAASDLIYNLGLPQDLGDLTIAELRGDLDPTFERWTPPAPILRKKRKFFPQEKWSVLTCKITANHIALTKLARDLRLSPDEMISYTIIPDDKFIILRDGKQSLSSHPDANFLDTDDGWVKLDDKQRLRMPRAFLDFLELTNGDTVLIYYKIRPAKKGIYDGYVILFFNPHRFIDNTYEKSVTW